MTQERSSASAYGPEGLLEIFLQCGKIFRSAARLVQDSAPQVSGIPSLVGQSQALDRSVARCGLSPSFLKFQTGSSRYISLRLIAIHAIRSALFAIATVAMFAGLVTTGLESQGRFDPLLRVRRVTAATPETRRRRRARQA